MTVSTTHVSNSFVGDGVTTAFNFTFQILGSTHLEAEIDDVVQSANDYTVVLNSDQEASPGGTLTFDTAPGDTLDVVITRVTPKTQTVSFDKEALLNTDALEQVLDKIFLISQELGA